MRKLTLLIVFVFAGLLAYGQGKHTDKFEQIGPGLRSPNNFRAASGAPGHEYWQNQADYDISITLDDEKQSITGKETITYINNSPDVLPFLWVQLDQNMRAQNSNTPLVEGGKMSELMGPWNISGALGTDFDGGFKISKVTDVNGKDLKYTINQTMMMVDIPAPLKKGEKVSFKIEWAYNINDRMNGGGRSGYEYFKEDNNYLYTIAQFYPRMCVYSDYCGWQNKQFLGGGEFTLPFGNFKVAITLPEDLMLGATGTLQNPKDVLSKEQQSRLEEAYKSDKPVMIVNLDEAKANESKRSKKNKTWVFQADMVRDFAFAASRKFVWDAMGVKIDGRNDRVWAMSYYPKEGYNLWEEYSTEVVAQTLKTYSKFTIPYPYPKAISVNAADIGMEYPMICFNFGRCDEKGEYTDRTKQGMIGVVIHEVGHNFFPMIINSDERQWTWMDEGLNTFVEYLTAVEWVSTHPKEKDYDMRGGPPQKITKYMSMDREKLSPIMTNSEQIQNFGPNAYSKPATGLNILRETVMGRELFDRAFKEYARRWAFKHPTPDDFFRTMEDASAVDLDWFWKGWFYSVDHTDVALTGVKRYKMNKKELSMDEARAMFGKAEEEKPKIEEADENEVKEFFTFRLSDEQKARVKDNTEFYEISLENIGGLVMPTILELTYKDGSTEIVRIPAELWRKNAEKTSKVIMREKELESVVLDPNLETADTDLSNNFWPAKKVPSRFELFIEKKTEDGGR